MTYKIEKGDLKLEYYPILEMIADFMCKKIQVKLFKRSEN